MMESLLIKLADIFSLEYMFSVIMASYLVIKVIDVLNGERTIASWLKRLITCTVGALILIIFIEFTDVSVQCLVASFFAAIFVYDTAIKAFMKKFNIDYKK